MKQLFNMISFFIFYTSFKWYFLKIIELFMDYFLNLLIKYYDYDCDCDFLYLK